MTIGVRSMSKLRKPIRTFLSVFILLLGHLPFVFFLYITSYFICWCMMTKNVLRNESKQHSLWRCVCVSFATDVELMTTLILFVTLWFIIIIGHTKKRNRRLVLDVIQSRTLHLNTSLPIKTKTWYTLVCLWIILVCNNGDIVVFSSHNLKSRSTC